MSHITLPTDRPFENWKWITDSLGEEKKRLFVTIKLAIFLLVIFSSFHRAQVRPQQKAKHFSLFQHSNAKCGGLPRKTMRYVLFNFLLPFFLLLRDVGREVLLHFSPPAPPALLVTNTTDQQSEKQCTWIVYLHSSFVPSPTLSGRIFEMFEKLSIFLVSFFGKALRTSRQRPAELYNFSVSSGSLYNYYYFSCFRFTFLPVFLRGSPRLEKLTFNIRRLRCRCGPYSSW